MLALAATRRRQPSPRLELGIHRQQANASLFASPPSVLIIISTKPVPFMNSHKLICLTAFTAASITSLIHADQQIDGHLEVLNTFTLRQDAFLEGDIWLGRLPSTSTPGIKIEVTQEATPTEQSYLVAQHYENRTVYVDDYGWLSQATQTWVEDYGYYQAQVWVEEWGDTYPFVWIPDQYDSDGILLVSGYWGPSSSPVYAMTGGHWETQEVWGIVGGHYESSGEDVWGVVGTHEEVQPVWVSSEYNSYTTFAYGIPQTRFIAQEEEMVWSWRNLGRELLEVSKAGVHVPFPGDTVGANNAMFTATQFEQSYATPSATGPYQSYGAKLSKEGIETWLDTGAEEIVSESESAKLKPSELLIQRKVPNAEGTMVSNHETRIAAMDARFGGNVAVKGILRIAPAGDVSMGTFTNGPQP